MERSKCPISLEERKKIQLEMLLEIDQFCREHDIKYMLAFGTLLGAIRHKGYIPWDDDVDISMPYEDMLRFQKEFKSEKLTYIDATNNKYFFYAFARIAYNPTYCKCGLICNSYGVNIDLYPTIQVSQDKEVNQAIVNTLVSQYKFRNYIAKWRSRAIRYLPIPNLPFVQYIARRYNKKMVELFHQPNGGNFHCIAGPLPDFDVHTFNFNPFDDLIEADFEGCKFMVPAKYHQYLTHRYGDYMQLPPEDQRYPYHGGVYYWK